MTVQDLITYLEKLPKDTVIGVVFQIHSDYEILEEESLVFYENPEKGPKVYSTREPRYILRNDKIMEYDPKTWDMAEGMPNFVSVLVLPGN